MRVIGGTARGRTLVAPAGRATRPTSDRVREALFSSLAAEVPGAVVLDLFAGSGALGIEALSRGARFAVFIDDRVQARRAITANLATSGLGDRAVVVAADAARFAAHPAAFLQRRGGPVPPPFDLVFCDPPYVVALERVLALLDDLDRAGALAPDAIAVVERDRRDPDLAAGSSRLFPAERDRAYGDIVLRYLRRAQDNAEESPR